MQIEHQLVAKTAQMIRIEESDRRAGDEYFSMAFAAASHYKIAAFPSAPEEKSEFSGPNAPMLSAALVAQSRKLALSQSSSKVRRRQPKEKS